MPALTSTHPLPADSRTSQLFPLLSDGDPVVPVGTNPLGVAVTPDGAHAYVANRGSDTVSVVDVATASVTATITATGGPSLPAVSPDGSRTYLSLSDAGQLAVIDTATNTITTTIPVGAGATGVAVTPDGAHVYVTAQIGNTVSVVDTATSTVTATITALNGPTGVAITPDGAHAYVANVGDHSVTVIDTATNTISTTIPAVGDVPIIPAVTPDGGRVYVTCAGAYTVVVIDTATNTVTTTIPVGNQPRVVAVNPEGANACVANLGDNTVSVIDTGTNTVVGNIPVGVAPLGVALSRDGLSLFVTNSGAGTLSIIPLTLEPDEGSTGGGAIVTLRGHDLANVSAVHFGTVLATILASTPTSVTVRVPAGCGSVPVTVTTPGGTGDFGTYYYRPAPVLSGISVISSPTGGGGPAEGPFEGGGTAVITGDNLSGAMAVRFGRGNAIIQSVTDTAVTVGVTGVQAPGPVHVTVVTGGGSADGLTYNYLAGPTLTAVSPASGPTVGGTLVTLTGTNLGHTKKITFDSIPVGFSVVSDTEVTATAPPHAAGSGITIGVSTSGGLTSSTFSYVDTPGI